MHKSQCFVLSRCSSISGGDVVELAIRRHSAADEHLLHVLNLVLRSCYCSQACHTGPSASNCLEPFRPIIVHMITSPCRLASSCRTYLPAVVQPSTSSSSKQCRQHQNSNSDIFCHRSSPVKNRAISTARPGYSTYSVMVRKIEEVRSTASLPSLLRLTSQLDDMFERSRKFGSSVRHIALGDSEYDMATWMQGNIWKSNGNRCRNL